jgi:hypothetical protein
LAQFLTTIQKESRKKNYRKLRKCTSMKKFSNELNQIIELYNTLNFSNEDDLLSEIKNKNTCENILAIVQTILNKEPHHFDALLWRIRINNSPDFNNTSAIQDDCNYILNTSTDITSRLQAYDWLIYIYLEKLSLSDIAIETLHDKLSEVAGIKDNCTLQDQAFGDTWLLSFRKKEMNPKRSNIT